MRIAMIPSFTSATLACRCLRKNSTNAAFTLTTSVSAMPSRSQQRASSRRHLHPLSTTSTTTQITNAQTIQAAPITSKRSISSKIQPIMMKAASMGAHAQLKFEWEEKRGWKDCANLEDLKKRINRIRNLSTEAQLCIQDCTESIHTPHFEEEYDSATKAVGNAEVAYSELLEELASRNQIELLNSARRIFASEVESVREELRDALDRLKQSENE